MQELCRAPRNILRIFLYFELQVRKNRILEAKRHLLLLRNLRFLPDDQKLIIEIAKVIRVGFLQQNAFHKDDTFVPLNKQKKMMKAILYLHKRVRQLISASIPISKVLETGIFDKLTRIKYDVPNDELEKFDDYKKEIDDVIDKIINNKI